MNSVDNNLNLPADPIDALLAWINEAVADNQPEPTAMALATATPDGMPNARIVLFKGVSTQESSGRRGPRFFTNYTSTKSQEITANPRATLVFHWITMQRQIRISGQVEKTSAAESNEYFQSRPRGSRIGAWASPQSQVIPNREKLERLVQETEERFADKEIPCPPHWGGWRLIPERIEFWHGGTYRLHDRIVYEWRDGKWQMSRLAP